MRQYIFPVTPVGKPRMTKADRWKKRPAVLRYWEFADALRALAVRARFSCPDHGIRLAFHFPMPPSWSKKKKAEMDGRPHKQKPDWDNCSKAFFDVLKGEDSTVWQIAGVEKRWTSGEGRIEVWIEEDREEAA